VIAGFNGSPPPVPSAGWAPARRPAVLTAWPAVLTAWPAVLTAWSSEVNSSWLVIVATPARLCQTGQYFVSISRIVFSIEPRRKAWPVSR
jgi:hypothetical protein